MKKEKKDVKKKKGKFRNSLIPMTFLVVIWFVLTVFLNRIIGDIGIIISSIMVTLLMLNSFVYIEPIHFGILLRFGKLNKALSEGWNMVIPIIDKLDSEFMFNLRPDPMDIKYNFITLNNRRIELDSEIRWAPNPNVKEPATNVPRYGYISDKMMQEGLNDKIDSEIGRIAGGFYWAIFRDERRGIENYINSILRMERPFHVNVEEWFKDVDGNQYKNLKKEWMKPDFWDNKETYTEIDNFSINTENELKTEIPFEKRIHFYSHFSSLIGTILRSKGDLGSDSDEENYYGVSIHNFTLGTVSFDQDTQEALEEAQRAKDRLEASDLIHNKKMERAENYKRIKGVTGQQALNSAEIDSQQAEGKNISIVGKGMPLILEGGKK